jgi:hypothetical protein
MKKLLLTAAVVAITSPAFAAEYYVVQNLTRNAAPLWNNAHRRRIGSGAGRSFLRHSHEAENYIKTTKVCEEGTVGGPSGGVRIEERKERR